MPRVRGARRAGAREVDAELRLWRLGPASRRPPCPRFAPAAPSSFAQAERTYRVAATADTPDPLQADEWWLSQIGIDGLTPPGPACRSRRRLRPRLLASRVRGPRRHDRPQPPGAGGHRRRARDIRRLRHRRAAERRRHRRDLPASGAPLVGHRQGRRHAARVDRDRGGILAAARAGRGVINLSLGSDSGDLADRAGGDEAVAWGRSSSQHPGTTATAGARWGTRPRSPRHDGGRHRPVGRRRGVLEPLPYVDLAAPGDDIIVASALGRTGGRVRHELLVAARRGRRRVDLDGAARADRGTGRGDPAPLGARHRRAGRDSASGFGMLNVAAALALPAPIRDPYEPNDDIEQVDPTGDRYVSQGAAAHDLDERRRASRARSTGYEDPRDVYRVWLPPGARVTATLTASANGDLALYAGSAPTRQSAASRPPAGSRARRPQGRRERLAYRNAARAAGRTSWSGPGGTPTRPTG